MEANQELPSWLEVLGVEARGQYGGRRSTQNGGGRFGPSKDVRLESGGQSSIDRMRSGWSGPPGSRMEINGGGSYKVSNGSQDWWDS